MNSYKERVFKQLPLILQAALCCFLWATAIPVLKISYRLLEIQADDIFNRLVLAGIRFFIAGILIGIFIYLKEKKITFVRGSQWKTVLIFGLLNTTLQYLFFYNGVGNTGAIKGVLIDTSKPLMVVILAHFLTKDDRITKNKILGLILGFIGILLSNIEGISKGGLDFNMTFRGEGFLLLSSFANAVAVIYGKKAMKEIPSLRLNMHQMTIGAIVLFVIGMFGANGYHLEFEPASIMLLLYSSLLSAVAFVVWYSLIHKYSASSVTIFIFLIPVFGSIISSVVFPDEFLTWTILGSLVLMSLGIFLVNKAPGTVKSPVGGAE